MMSSSDSSLASNGSGGGSGSGGSSNPLSALGLDNPEVAGFVSKIKSRKWVATLRPLPAFAGAGMFSKPRTTQEALARLEANLPFFLTNYLALCAVVIVVTILTQPSLLLIGALIALMWAAATRQEEIRAGQVVLAGRNKVLVLASVSGLLLFLFAGTTIFFIVGICASIVLGHSILHDLPPLDDSGEGGSFLGGESADDSLA